MLVRMYYASTASSGVDMNEFKTILATAQKNNTQRDITGMLVFNSKVFLQCLEGDRDALNDLYVKLVRDPRHSRLAILSFEQVRTRHFADWSMAFTPLNASNRALFLKYSAHSMFNPYAMSADAVEEFMHDIAGTSLKMGQAEEEKKGLFARLRSSV